jgi:hypothetical protein
VLGALNDGGVRFVVIGGIAVSAHGHIRGTEDLDIVPAPDQENLDRLGNVLVGLGARLGDDPSRGIDPEVRGALYRGRSLTVTTALGDLDVVQQLPGIPAWEELEADAERTTLAGIPLAVSSLPHLLAMKRARGSLQDRADIEALES